MGESRAGDWETRLEAEQTGIELPSSHAYRSHGEPRRRVEEPGKEPVPVETGI